MDELLSSIFDSKTGAAVRTSHAYEFYHKVKGCGKPLSKEQFGESIKKLFPCVKKSRLRQPDGTREYPYIKILVKLDNAFIHKRFIYSVLSLLNYKKALLSKSVCA